MSFRSNSQLEGIAVGSRVRLNAPVRVLKGEFGTGSIVEIISEPDARGEVGFRDIDSGETFTSIPSWISYTKLD